VPCDGCGAACCTGTDVRMLAPIDDPARYRTETRADGRAYLLRDDADRCTHLTADDRCEVYADRPFMCRTFDCRVYPAGRTLMLDPGTDHLTLACVAGMTRFLIVPQSAAESAAMVVVNAEAQRLVQEEGLDGHAALAAACLLWPQRTGGPAAQYLRNLQRHHAPVLDRILEAR